MMRWNRWSTNNVSWILLIIRKQDGGIICHPDDKRESVEWGTKRDYTGVGAGLQWPIERERALKSISIKRPLLVDIHNWMNISSIRIFAPSQHKYKCMRTYSNGNYALVDRIRGYIFCIELQQSWPYV